MSKVLTREECNKKFSKEKFLSSLPLLFAEKVRDKLRIKHNGHISYSHYNYNELATEVVAEGLTLLNDIKLKQQLKKDKILEKKSL